MPVLGNNKANSQVYDRKAAKPCFSNLGAGFICVSLYAIQTQNLMKKAITLLLILSSACGFAQTAHPSQPMPAIYVDSVMVSEYYFKSIQPNDILRVDVKRAKEFPNGVIYITTKNKQKTEKLLKSPLLSLGNIAKANILGSQKSRPIIFLLDGAMLTDTANIRIPSLSITGVTVNEAANTPYFKTALPDVIILMVSTKPITIAIRGESLWK